MNFFTTILGSGAALPTGRRHCSGQVVNINGFKILIDCAEGTQDRIRYNHLRLQSISVVVISHLHGDHFFGLAGLLSTMHLCGRTEPITVIAPRGAEQVILTTFDLTGNHIAYPIHFHELDFEQGQHRVFENTHCTIDAFPLIHTIPTYGYRITEVPRGTHSAHCYVYACDTVFSPTLVPFFENADLLCLESTFDINFADLATQRLHLTSQQAAQLALQANAQQLLLTHISARYREPDTLLEHARQIFPNTLIAEDNQRIEIGTSKSKNIQ